MSHSNLRSSLETAYKNWLGEKLTLSDEIAKIRKALDGLAAKEKRLATVERLIVCSETILQEINPNFDASKVKPRKKNAMQLPFAVGDVTRWTFEILRQASEPIRSRAIAEQIMKRNDIPLDDKHMLKRVTASVDASLRGKVGEHVEKLDTWPIRWRIIEHPTKNPYGR